jgi:hypothetical protein
MQTHNKLQTRLLTTDYIIWRLEKEGLFTNINNNSTDNMSSSVIFERVDLKKNAKFKICSIMREMSYEFEKLFNNTYFPLIDKLDLKINNSKDTFFSIALELFQVNTDDKSTNYFDRFKKRNCITKSGGRIGFECNWGRIVGIFSFAGCLAIKSAKITQFESDSNIITSWKNIIYNIIDWLTQFLNNEPRIFDWIENNGGWVRFVDQIIFI